MQVGGVTDTLRFPSHRPVAHAFVIIEIPEGITQEMIVQRLFVNGVKLGETDEVGFEPECQLKSRRNSKRIKPLLAGSGWR